MTLVTRLDLTETTAVFGYQPPDEFKQMFVFGDYQAFLRQKIKMASFKDGVEEMKDLTPGMLLEGVVTNVANFGAFVDIGVHQDGLVHISAMSKTFIKDPREVVKPGDIVKVKVLEVDLKRKRISLTMRLRDDARAAPPGKPAGEGVALRDLPLHDVHAQRLQRAPADRPADRPRQQPPPRPPPPGQHLEQHQQQPQVQQQRARQREQPATDAGADPAELGQRGGPDGVGLDGDSVGVRIDVVAGRP